MDSPANYRRRSTQRPPRPSPPSGADHPPGAAPWPEGLAAAAPAAIPAARPSPLSWSDLACLEPRLAQLLAKAKRVKDDGAGSYFCANACWYGYDGWPGFKPWLLRLVGRERPETHPVLSTPAAYDVAVGTIYNVLPGCRGPCGCL
jgi:hypothetical protein